MVQLVVCCVHTHMCMRTGDDTAAAAAAAAMHAGVDGMADLEAVKCMDEDDLGGTPEELLADLRCARGLASLGAAGPVEASVGRTVHMRPHSLTCWLHLACWRGRRRP